MSQNHSVALFVLRLPMDAAVGMLYSLMAASAGDGGADIVRVCESKKADGIGISLVAIMAPFDQGNAMHWS